MCAITGFIDFTNTSSQATLEAMRDTMVHRGPDGAGIHFEQHTNLSWGFGHRRLSIIDLTENAAQPMAWNDDWICFNGEIYNYAEIKADLQALGHTFQSSSDTEMILHAFRQWGVEAVHRFVGMFAIAWYDRKNEQFWLVRDRAGVKPLFYYWNDGLLLFASELKAFHEHPRFAKKINPNAVAAFMQYGYVPSPHCIFENTHKLLPGHWLKIDLKRPNELKTEQYWSVYTAYNQPKWSFSREEAIAETEKVLQKAVEYRMVADVPVGVFLSGGYDSACVTSLLQKERTQPLKTFTIGVPDIGLNEAPYAKDVAKHLGTDHTEFTCTHREAMELIPDLPFFYDEPFADSSAIPTTLVSKMARQAVTVALSADAGDEVFAGYNRYDYIQRYGAKLQALPAFVRRAAVAMMQKIDADAIPVLRNKYNFHNRYEKLKMVLANPSSQNILLSLSQQYTDEQIKAFVQFPVTKLPTAFDANLLEPANFSPLAFSMAMDYETYLLDDILQKVDRATMSVSLEGREPFLDQNVIEFAARIPDEWKYYQGTKKYLVKEIVHQYVPKSLMDRPKMGFAIPIGDWLMNDLRDLVEAYTSEEKIRASGVFRPEAVRHLKAQFFAGKKELDYKMWYLLMFQMWYEKWGN